MYRPSCFVRCRRSRPPFLRPQSGRGFVVADSYCGLSENGELSAENVRYGRKYNEKRLLLAILTIQLYNINNKISEEIIMKVAVGCDHGGIVLKESVVSTLEDLGATVEDLGTYDESSVDYPVYGLKVAKAVASGECDCGEHNRARRQGGHSRTGGVHSEDLVHLGIRGRQTSAQTGHHRRSRSRKLQVSEQ